jgi:putative aldouronate transport system permease protein
VADIIRVLRNTFAMSLLGIATSPLPLVFAVFLSEVRIMPFRKTVQTLTTIPNFISWVLVYSVAYAMFSVDDGFLNRLLIQLGVINNGIPFLTASNHVWLTMWSWGTWKGLGWSSIIYIAAITSIDQELYEAARVDGAGRFMCMWHITLPGLIPTYFVLLILSIANFINSGMEQYYIFQNPMNKSAIEVLDLYVYNQGITGINYSYSIAVGILKSVVSLILLFIANSGSKLYRKESVF